MKINWDDIDIHGTYEFGAAHMAFYLYEVTGHTSDDKGDYTIPIYERKGAKSSEDTTENINDAQPMIQGTIKWDACSHLYFGDDGYLHVCGGRNWKILMIALERIFDLARKHFNEDHQKDMFDDYDSLPPQVALRR